MFFTAMFMNMQMGFTSHSQSFVVCKYLYCITFLRGVGDSMSFWVVDNHARKLVRSFFRSLLSTMEEYQMDEEIDILTTVDLDGMVPIERLHGTRRHDESIVKSSISLSSTGNNINLDRVYGIDKP
jgi:hypothetical protein